MKQERIAWIWGGLALFCTIGVFGCSVENPVEPLDECAGATMFEFGLRNKDSSKRFMACTGDPDVIQQVRAQLSLLVEFRSHIHGTIAAGNAGNLAWSWHFVKDEWTLADMSIELCDGDPTYIEEHLDAWLMEVGSYCPGDRMSSEKWSKG